MSAALCVLVSVSAKAETALLIFVLVVSTRSHRADSELASIFPGDLASSIFLVSRPGVPRDRPLTVSGSLRFS